MNPSIPLLALFATVAFVACDKPTVVNVPAPAPPPAAAVPVPGPAGPQGEPGKPSDSTTVIVVPPPASAPSN
jgi:hypothetical protein